MKKFALMLLLFLVFGGMEAFLSLFGVIYIISKLWGVILFIVATPILGVIFSKVKFPKIIYTLSFLGLIIGLLGDFTIAFYSIFIEKIDEEIMYSFVSLTGIGLIINFNFLHGKEPQ